MRKDLILGIGVALIVVLIILASNGILGITGKVTHYLNLPGEDVSESDDPNDILLKNDELGKAGAIEIKLGNSREVLVDECINEYKINEYYHWKSLSNTKYVYSKIFTCPRGTKCQSEEISVFGETFIAGACIVPSEEKEDENEDAIYQDMLTILNSCTIYEKSLADSTEISTSCNDICNEQLKTCILGEMHTISAIKDKTSLTDCSTRIENADNKIIRCVCCSA